MVIEPISAFVFIVIGIIIGYLLNSHLALREDKNKNG